MSVKDRHFIKDLYWIYGKTSKKGLFKSLGCFKVLFR